MAATLYQMMDQIHISRCFGALLTQNLWGMCDFNKSQIHLCLKRNIGYPVPCFDLDIHWGWLSTLNAKLPSVTCKVLVHKRPPKGVLFKPAITPRNLFKYDTLRKCNDSYWTHLSFRWTTCCTNNAYGAPSNYSLHRLIAVSFCCIPYTAER